VITQGHTGYSWPKTDGQVLELEMIATDPARVSHIPS